MQLESLLWQGKNELNVGELWKQLCTYCYLPRLASFEVLQNAIQTGVDSEEYFAYADGVENGHYVALKYNHYVGFIDKSGYLVTQIAALKQQAAEAQAKPAMPSVPAQPQPDFQLDLQRFGNEGVPVTPQLPEQSKNTHFAMTATLDTTRVVRNVGNLMDEVINHLLQIDGAKVELRLLVEATMPDGTPVPTVRTVQENCRTLRVDNFGFDG